MGRLRKWSQLILIDEFSWVYDKKAKGVDYQPLSLAFVGMTGLELATPTSRT